MRRLIISATALVMTLGFGLAARSASARICCSRCDVDPLPAPCRSGCTPTCLAGEDDDGGAPDEVFEDDVMQASYLVIASADSACDA
jgi:hypothetical protein